MDLSNQRDPRDRSRSDYGWFESYLNMMQYRIYADDVPCMQGRVVSYNVFDTFGDGSSSLVAHLSGIGNGRIVCFAVLVSFKLAHNEI